MLWRSSETWVEQRVIAQRSQDAASAMRLVTLSLAYWAAYYLLMLARLWVADEPPTLGYLGYSLRYIPLSLFGVALSVGLFVLFKKMKKRPFWESFAIAFGLTVPAALVFGAVSNFLFYYSAPEAIAALGPYQPYTVKMMMQQGLPWSATIFGWNALVLAMRYSKEVAEGERRLAQVQALAHKAQVLALRYQINPHFLFNTLNSISSMIWERELDRAEAMLVSLSDFLRTSLEIDPCEDVTLEQEIALQMLYLEIEQIRFGERLKVIVDVPDDLGAARVPSLILQPLVENAIRYAVAPSQKQTILTMTARRSPKSMRIVVEDDGDVVSTFEGGMGVGLANVHDRLTTRFGTGVSFHAGPIGKGFRVELEMPLEFV